MTLNGIDISSFQGGINLAAIPADFVFIKATGGTGYVNPDCDRTFQQALAAGKKVGVYHFAHEQGFQGSAEQEADFFLKNVQGYIGKAILMLDWESDNTGDIAWAKSWLDHVHNATGVKPLIYMSTSILKAHDFSSVKNGDYGLWLAQYPDMNPVNGYNPIPCPDGGEWGGNVAMYQYTSTGRLPNWNGNLDLDVFYGDRNTWDAFAKGNKPNPVPPKPPVDPTRDHDHLPTLDDGKAKAHLDRFGPLGDKLVVEGWHTFVCDHEYIFILDRITGKELARKEVKPLHRPDVKKAFGLGYDEVGFKTDFDLKQFRCHSVIALIRGTDNREGNPSANWDDLTETRWWHDV